MIFIVSDVFFFFKSFLSNILFPHVCIEVIDHHADKYLWFINETVSSVGERFHCTGCIASCPVTVTHTPLGIVAWMLEVQAESSSSYVLMI